jgi:two-component system NtrC family sensor kinase
MQRVAIRYALQLLVLFFTLFTSCATFSQANDRANTVTLSASQDTYPLGLSLKLLEDPQGRLTIQDVLRPEIAATFQDSDKAIPSFGFSPSAYWARVDLDERDSQRAHWVLVHAYAPTQWIDVYTIDRHGDIHHQRGGIGIAHAERPVPHHRHAFYLKLPHDQTTTLYVRIDGESSKNFNLTLQRQEYFIQAAKQETGIFGIFAGMMAALILYNFFIFVTLRDFSYLVYVSFLATSLLFQLSLNGLAQAWISSEHATIGIRLIPFGLALATLTAMIFTMQFLESKHRLPNMHRIMQVASIIASVDVLLPFLTSYRTSMMSVTALGIPMPFIVISMGIMESMKRNTSALYFTFAWSLMLVGILLQSLRAFGIIPTNVVTENAMLWGSSAEAILLSLALASRMRTMKEQRQQALIDAAEASEEAMASRQLAFANQKKALEQQKIALEQEKLLVEKEKMANLGLLSAGIAHEINNPNNFLMIGAQNAESNITALHQYLYELMGDERDPDITEDIDRRFAAIHTQMDLVKEGSGRIANIVKSMRSASRADDPSGQAFDPVEGLLTTLELIKPTYSTIADFEVSGLKRYGEVKGSSSRLNQVFTNLIVNGCHAIEEKQRRDGQKPKGTITLMSQRDANRLIISIQDTGCGMTEDVKARLFQPFFTTKGSDRGTGLGLGICRNIVTEHEGSIEIESTAGQGSVFRVILPLLA